MSTLRATGMMLAFAVATVAGAQQPAKGGKASHDTAKHAAAPAKAAHDSAKKAEAPAKAAPAKAPAKKPPV